MREQLQSQLEIATRWRRRGDYRRAGLLLTLTLVAAESHAFDGAIADYAEALAMKERLLGAAHPELATTLVSLGAALRTVDRRDAATPRYPTTGARR